MKITLSSKIRIVINIDGVDHVLTATPDSLKPVQKTAGRNPPTGAVKAVEKVLSDDERALGYVDATALNGRLDKKIPSKTLGCVLDHLGYHSSIRLKCRDRKHHYFRYNPFVITENDLIDKVRE